MSDEDDLKNIVDLTGLCKRRGFLFQSSEIYGGAGGLWDYGSLGVELKKNIQKSWWESMTFRRDVVGLDSSILMHPKVWKASGHVENFHDPMVDCKVCKSRFRADQIDPAKACPKCGSKDSFTKVRNFNMMFKTWFGPMEESAMEVYLRPETAQGIFVNFHNVRASMRMKLPFGIAQVGKAFRNEITPGHFIFRMREFEQLEMQYFIKPQTQEEAFKDWRRIRYEWYLATGLRPKKLRQHPHAPQDLAHYADAAEDIEYEFPHGWGEIEGIHSRTDFDLARHQEYSGKSQLYSDQETGEKYLPFVLETSMGGDRCVLAVLCDAYRIENPQDRKTCRTVLRLHPKIAPIKTAVLPLMKKSELEEIAQKMFLDLQKSYLTEYDYAGTIGKRYRRQDEIGTPFCVTIDYTTLEDQTVTVRHRDSMSQTRIAMDRVKDYLKDKLGGMT